MRALGQVEIDKLATNNKYKDLFTALSEEEYGDLRTSIAKSGVLVALIVEKEGNEFVVLSGHHRLQASKELGLTHVPCNEVETLDEQATAVFDNVTRRQMEPRMRRQMAQREKEFLETELKERLLPDIFELYKAKVMTETVAKEVAFMSREKQGGLLRDFREGLKSQGEKSDERIAEIKVIHDRQIKKLQSDLEMAQQSMDAYKRSVDGKDKTIAEKQEEIERLRKVEAKAQKDLKKKLEELEKKKEEAAGAVREEIKNEMAELQEEQRERSKIIDDKNKEIERLLEERKTFQTQLQAKEGDVHLVQMKMVDVVNKHNAYVEQMASPAILEVRLNAIVAELDTMLTYVIHFRWSDKAVNVAAKKVKEIAAKATKLAEYVADNQAKDLGSE